MVKDVVRELQNRVKDDFKRMNVFVVPREKTRYLKPQLFGPEVEQVFANAVTDIEEAGKCLAYNRNTAAVFHMMRTMEEGLRLIGTRLNEIGVPVSMANPTWETILRPIDKETARNFADKTDDWKRNEHYFSEMGALLRGVKIAWRNETMHVAKVYNEEVTADIFGAVRTFMRFIATQPFPGKMPMMAATTP